MGDQNSLLDEAEARHLLRRTGFGVKRVELERSDFVGMKRGEAAEEVVGEKRKRFRPGGREPADQHNKWFKFLLKNRAPFSSKLALFLHDHFSTNISKVENTKLMGDQIRLFYEGGRGSFKDLVKSIGKNPAMIEFLDTVRNRKQDPNENYARELMELFTLGVKDFAGNANYAQEDIVQIARAFTGWRYEGRSPEFIEHRHDYATEYPERGPKILFDGVHGFPPGGASFITGGEGPDEIDAVVDILFQHTDSQGKNTVARRTARRLLEYFAHPEPETAVVDEVVAASGFDTNWEIGGLCRAIFVHDAFYLSAAPAPFGASTKKSVKWPIDYAVTSLRLTGVKPKSREQFIAGGSYTGMFSHLENMGQVILDPPSVFGWDWETRWLNTATLLARYNFARDIVSARDGGRRFRPEKLMDLDLTDPVEVVNAVIDVLDLNNQFTDAEHALLVVYLTDDGVFPTVDLNHELFRNVKLHGLFALVMQSPAYHLH